jgi:hypothetical protein
MWRSRPCASSSCARLSQASSRSSTMVTGSGSFVTGGCLQLGSRASSLRGTGVVTCTTISSVSGQQRSRSVGGVVSPRAVSDSQTVRDACLDPDASRVSRSVDAVLLSLIPPSTFQSFANKFSWR